MYIYNTCWRKDNSGFRGHRFEDNIKMDIREKQVVSF